MKKTVEIKKLLGISIEEIKWDNNLDLKIKSKMIKKIIKNRNKKGHIVYIVLDNFIEEDEILLKEISIKKRFEGVYLKFDKLNLDNLNIKKELKDCIRNHISI